MPAKTPAGTPGALYHPATVGREVAVELEPTSTVGVDDIWAEVDEAPERFRRRRVLPLALAVVVAGAAAAGVAVNNRADDDGPGIALTAAIPPRVELVVAPGWESLHASGDHLVVGTRPLKEQDLLLALLARDDAAFSAFPADGAIFVVGGDRLKAKYTGDPSRAIRSVENGVERIEMGPDSMVGPGPALGLGPARTLAGGVTVRLGDVPRSGVTLAAYLGPKAGAAAMQATEAMAATVRLQPVDRATMPPPPPGSRPGFDQGVVQLTDGQRPPVVSATAPGVTYAARAEGDCAVVGSSASTQPLGGGCMATPTAPRAAEVVAVARETGPPPPPPGQTFAPGTASRWASTVVVLVRVSPDIRRLSAVLTDGRSVTAVVGSDGWAMLATDGRPYLLEGRDGSGKVVVRTPVD